MVTLLLLVDIFASSLAPIKTSPKFSKLLRQRWLMARWSHTQARNPYARYTRLLCKPILICRLLTHSCNHNPFCSQETIRVAGNFMWQVNNFYSYVFCCFFFVVFVVFLCVCVCVFLFFFVKIQLHCEVFSEILPMKSYSALVLIQMFASKTYV